MTRDAFRCPKPFDRTLTFHGHWFWGIEGEPTIAQWGQCTGCDAWIRWTGKNWMAINRFYVIKEEP